MVALPRIDPATEINEEDQDLFNLWVSNLVDTINSAMEMLDADLASIDARLTAGGL